MKRVRRTFVDLFVAACAILAVLAVAACDQPGGAPPSTPVVAERPAPAVSQRQRASSHDLAGDESLGGHTLQRHVGKSDADLRDRLRRETDIGTASTYTDRDTAESTVAAALAAGQRELASWTRRRGRRPNLVLRYESPNGPLGRCLRRGRDAAEPCSGARVVLRWDERRQRFFVLTSYPEP